LTLEQLLGFKTQLEAELQKLTGTIQLTNETIAKTLAGKDALMTFSNSEVGKDILIPVTESMYVHGTVQETKRPIVELGTGYYVETSVEKAAEFVNKRVSRLKNQQEGLRNTFKEKQQQYQLVVTIANRKIQASRAAH
jgi:prefoldin alpha subunit